MRLKDLFTVPKGQKVTEKHLRRVLIASICSILLCMSCMVNATLAWFTLSIENKGNQIWIGEPKINVFVNGGSYASGSKLSGNDVTLQMFHANEKTDDFNKKSTLYVTLTIQGNDSAETVCVTLDESNGYSLEVNIQNRTENACKVSWTVSWFKPDNADALDGAPVILEAAESAGSAEQEITEPSEETPSQETTESSVAETTSSAVVPSEEPDTEDPEEQVDGE